MGIVFICFGSPSVEHVSSPVFGSDLGLQFRVMVLFVFVLCIGTTFHFGFNIAVANAPSEFVKDFINQTWIQRYGTPTPDETLTLLWSLIVSIYSLGGLLGTLGSGYVIREYGKRRCQMYSNMIVMLAALFMGFSKMAWSFEMILVGRFLCGINSGVGFSMCFQYLGEIAPKKQRGLINSSACIFLTSGKIFGQIFGLREALGTECLWPLLMSISGFTALIQLAAFPFFPDTPPELLMEKNDKEGCIKAMKKLWGDGEHQTEIEDLLKEQYARKNIKIHTFLELMRDRPMRPQLCILMVSTTMLQLNGVNAIYFYASNVFREAGLTPDHIPYITIGIGISELLGTVLCSFLIDRCGRKVLLLGGLGVMCIALTLLTVTLSLQDLYPWIPYCSIVLIFCFSLFFGMGQSGVSMAIVNDVLTQSTRASAGVLIGSMNWLGLYLIGMVFPYMVANLGQFSFLIFLGLLIASGSFFYLFLPETKGKSIIETTEELHRIWRKRMCCQAPMDEATPEYVTCTKF